MRSLSDWLSWLETLHPKAIDLGLERVQQVIGNMELDHFACPVITIAGTNGKGSCVAFLESIYSAQGYNVGAYTSPHLLCYNERIRIQGAACDDGAIVAAFRHIDSARGDISLTYFEFATLAALWLFKQAPLDVILLEVGLGGRLDAVNAVDANLAIITTIDFDHMEWLGDTREAIGHEKAGIFRTGKPAICGDFNPPASIIQHANKLNAPLFCINKAFEFMATENSWQWHTIGQSYTELPLPVLALQNAATSLMAINCLQTVLPVNIQAIKTGIKQANVIGRFQLVQQSPQVIVDVAHNAAAAKMLAHKLQETLVTGKTIAVFSALQDKNISDIISHFHNIITQWHIAPVESARSCTIEELRQAFNTQSIFNVVTHLSVKNAFQYALLHCDMNDRLIIFGSFLTVAEALNSLPI